MERKRHMLMGLGMIIGSVITTVAQTPAVPTQLQADVEGCKVSLHWQRGGEVAVLENEGFEGEAFPSPGWEMKSYNTTDYRCSWFHYPSDDFKELGNWEYYINNGEGSAMVYMDMGYHENVSYNQDEWLISPVYDNAVYLDFWYYINPMLLEYAQFSDFVDKYCVELSHDGGETWEVIWDARYYHSGLDEWQQVSLYLGEPTPNTRIAFHAQSDMENDYSTLYFSWTIDDVTISSEGASNVSSLSGAKCRNKSINEAMQSYRVFESNYTDGGRRNIVQEEPDVTSYYQILLNGEIIADKVCSLQYVDVSEKAPGTYSYEVKYVTKQGTSESAAIEVIVEESTFNVPTNVQVTSTFYEDKDWGEVIISWEAPEGNRKPTSYSVYINGILSGVELPVGEMGNTWVTKGVYTYEVAAVYEYPSGESERVGDQVAIDTRLTPRNLEASINDEGEVSLSWEAAKTSDVAVQAYKVYRGNTEIASIEPDQPLSYVDTDILSGCYTYSVKAQYSDGELSLPVQKTIFGEEYFFESLPYSQTFDGDLTPDNWQAEMLNTIDAMYTWRFDNWFEIATLCDKVEGGFASITSEANEFYNIISSLATPIFDCSNVPTGENVIISCTMDFSSLWEMAYFCMEVSNDGGESWEWLADIYPSDIEDYQYEIDVTSATVSGSPMFRFVYDGCGDGYVIIDNFRIYVTDNMGVEATRNECAMISLNSGNDELSIAAVEPIENVYIYNTSGMLVMSQDGNRTNRQVVSLRDLQQGLYIAKVRCASHIVEEKIIVR